MTACDRRYINLLLFQEKNILLLDFNAVLYPSLIRGLMIPALLEDFSVEATMRITN